MAEQTDVPAKLAGRRLRHLDPAALVDAFEDEVERVWPFGLRIQLRRPFEITPLAVPRVNIFERAGQLVIMAELPGVKKEDLALTFDQGDLVIHGERKPEPEVQVEHYYRMERRSGHFYRRLSLPIAARADQIQAHYSDGVLEITLPLPVEAKSEGAPIVIV
jgi:HSP20 family molecular chaperone IbpA